MAATTEPIANFMTIPPAIPNTVIAMNHPQWSGIYGAAIVTDAPISIAAIARAVRECMDLMIVSWLSLMVGPRIKKRNICACEVDDISGDDG